MTIPKIIHHIWIGNNPIPEENMYYANSVREKNPDFEYMLWKDEDADKLFREDFPEYYQKFKELPRLIMKIDILKYTLMYKYGGLCTDMDYLMFRPFDLLDKKVVIPCNRENEKGKPSRLGTCIFASEKDHPFWKSLLDTLLTIDRTQLDYKSDSFVEGDSLAVGPVFLYSMWKKYSKKNRDIYVPRRDLFHPYSENNEKQIQKVKEMGCYGMHICTGLWRDNRL